jgi:hypothetical protein
MKEPWYESDNPSTVVRGGTWRVGIWLAIVIGVIAIVGIGVWGFRVITSDVAGQGNATIQKNSANNRIAAQERFEQMYQDIKASDRKIAVAAAALAVNKDDKTLQTNYTGTVNYCIQAVGDYNAEARKFTAEDFRSPDLPYQISTVDPDTDCKE